MESAITEIQPRATDERGASVYADMSVSWLRKKRLEGGGPPYVKIGRSVRYLIADLDDWLENHRTEAA